MAHTFYVTPAKTVKVRLKTMKATKKRFWVEIWTGEKNRVIFMFEKELERAAFLSRFDAASLYGN